MCDEVPAICWDDGYRSPTSSTCWARAAQD